MGTASGCLGAYLLLLSNKADLEIQVSQGQKFKREGDVW
jgi:predicted PhzF superfamily epimerase YddE/YHI9